MNFHKNKLLFYGYRPKNHFFFGVPFENHAKNGSWHFFLPKCEIWIKSQGFANAIFQKKFGSLLRTFLIRATFYKRSCCHLTKSLAWPRGAPNWDIVDLPGLKGVFFNKEQKISSAQRGFVSEKNAKPGKNRKNLVSGDLYIYIYIYIYIGTKTYFFLLFPFFPFSPLPSFPLFPFPPFPPGLGPC